MVLSKVNLDRLRGRFLRDVPQREEDMIAFFSKIEKAWWFYSDHRGSTGLRDDGSVKFAQFVKDLFASFPGLSLYSQEQAERFTSEWWRHKHVTLRCRCIIIDDTCRKVLLVKGGHPYSPWLFPGGRMEEGEEPHRCAVREVEEEIGLDCASLIDPDNFLEHTQDGRSHMLYIITGVSEETELHIRVRREISEARWFDIEGIPASDPPGRKFHFIAPVVGRIRGLVSALPPSDASISETRWKRSTSVLPPKFSEIIDCLRKLPPRLGKPSGGIDLRPQCSWFSGN